MFFQRFRGCQCIFLWKFILRTVKKIQYMKLSGRNRHVCNVVDIDMMYVIVGLKLILDQFNVRLVICLKKK